MNQISINGSSVVYTNIPAGFATIDTSAPVAGVVTVGGAGSSADVLILAGATAAGFDLVVSAAPVSSIDTTFVAPLPPPAPPSPAVFVASWVKIVNNLSSGQTATVKGTLSTGLPSAGLAVAAGAIKLVFFDGTNAPFTLT